MKKLWRHVGVVLFWVSWPVLWVYFRTSGPRARVVIISDNEVLLVQSWMGENKYGLPGGGSHKGEPVIKAAVREVYEETGISLNESGLKYVGSRNETKYGLRYKAEFYVAELARHPETTPQKLEIHELRWVPLDQIHTLQVQDDALDGISKYRPVQQGNLL